VVVAIVLVLLRRHRRLRLSRRLSNAISTDSSEYGFAGARLHPSRRPTDDSLAPRDPHLDIVTRGCAENTFAKEPAAAEATVARVTRNETTRDIGRIMILTARGAAFILAHISQRRTGKGAAGCPPTASVAAVTDGFSEARTGFVRQRDRSKMNRVEDEQIH
jgi:hypothetical protein